MFYEKLSLHDYKSIDAKILTPSTNLRTFQLVNVTTFLRVKPSKISPQSPRSNQESSDRF